MAGLRLKAVREMFYERGPIKQDAFAAKIGVARTALANWESGKLPDIRAIVRLYDWLGVPLEWIYLGQTRHVELALAERLISRALELGAAVEGARFRTVIKPTSVRGLSLAEADLEGRKNH